MKIALIGYGGMGQVVKRIAASRGHEVPVIVSPGGEVDVTHEKISAEDLSGIDMVIDFSLGDAVMDHVKLCTEVGVNLVVGTTGWYDRLDEVKAVLNGSDIGFLWSSNFSIGVNLYFKIVEAAARMVNNFDEYDIWGHEIHHNKKADSPSGTAKSLEDILLSNIDRKESVVEDRLNRRREDNEIHFSSVRGGAVNFGHTIGFDSAADTISISHAARNRDGYALGAVKAAEWLDGKKGYFEMVDFLNF